jgi:preprotein translocase subunit SecE|tara:strand:+ start:306 stop:521 length:216 start_codon:yes stop_codon:yes gene_type:complete
MNIEKKKTNPAQFVRQVRQEMQKVTWPGRKDTFISSAIVILLVVLFSLFFLVTDQIWSKGLQWIIEKGSGF